MLKCEILIDFLVNTLDNQSFELAKNLSRNLKEEYSKRRSPAFDVLCFLSQMDKKLPPGHISNFYTEPSKDLLNKFIQQFQISSFTEESANNAQQSSTSTVDDILNSVLNQKEHDQSVGFDSEYDQFVQFGILGTGLSDLKVILELIKPTSTDCERIFSTCSQVYTKFRYSLKHETLDALICLKRFFIKLDK